MTPLYYKTLHKGLAVGLIVSIHMLTLSPSVAQERKSYCIEKKLMCVERTLSQSGVWTCKKHEWRCTRWGDKPSMVTEPPKGSTVLPPEGVRKFEGSGTQSGGGSTTKPK